MFSSVSRFLFRSISRKITVWLFAIVVMFCVLCVASIIGLQSYKAAIDDCELCSRQLGEDHRRRRNLTIALGKTLQPLGMFPQDAEGYEYQRREFRQFLSAADESMGEYREHIGQLPGRIRSANPHVGPWLRQVTANLESIQSRYERQLSDGPVGQAQLRDAIVGLITRVQSGPETTTHSRLLTLKDGRERYWWLSRAVYLCATISAIVSLCIFVFGYRSVFCRIRKVHRGARRVAQGDFDYRLVMHSDDEMGELADAFNQMTCRFQEIEQDLEHQVSDRSQQLVRSAQLADMGVLAAGVAHEINNPLQAVRMAAESLDSRLTELFPACAKEEVQHVRNYLKMIQDESERCREITRKVLDFARKNESTGFESYDIVDVIQDVVEMVHIGVNKQHAIVFEPQQPCVMEINKGEIKQVVLNLSLNALESMKSPGTLQIEVIEQTDQVILQFVDDGCGMTPDIIERLFEPFFTQRAVGNGTGLGLSITNRIVEDHSGTIEATSEGAGRGSTFRVRLPRRQIAMQSDAA